MGKKRATIIGSENEDLERSKKAVKLEQKKLRTGKSVAIHESTPTPTVVAEPTVTPVSKKPEHHRSKAYSTAKTQVDPSKTYSYPEAIKLLRSISLTKFDPSVELHVTLKTIPETKLTVNLPHAVGSAKKVSIATDEVIAQIETGKIDFDILVASPTQMAKLVKFAKVLGPKGLMPNPKNGTVSDNPESAAKRLASDQSTALKVDKAASAVHIKIGKLTFTDSQLSENVSAVLAMLTKSSPKKVVLKSTMSPAIKVAL